MTESEINVGRRYRTQWGVIEVTGVTRHPEDDRMIYWAKDDPVGYYAAEIIEEVSA
jgi:hypothetical protein